MVVYSGQGCHVYLLDDDPDHRYDETARELINDALTKDHDIPIDTVVTADRRRVTRLPYSLHADVSRIVTPIDTPDYDFRNDPVPQFLTADDTSPDQPIPSGDSA
jgi:DNA primase catalytic subunit